jgi:RNA recognition motif. (a.k.a. RRM, RBD, or RNP domain)
VNNVLNLFQKFGDIEYIRFVKDRKTGDSRGLAYVKFKRAYHAALALEGCDSRKYFQVSLCIETEHLRLCLICYLVNN